MLHKRISLVVILHRRYEGQECGKTEVGEERSERKNTENRENIKNRQKGYLRETSKDDRGILVLDTVEGCISLIYVFRHH